MKKFICALTSASVILSCVPVFASSGIITATDEAADAKLELANELKDLFVYGGEMSDEELAAKLAHTDELQAIISCGIATATDTETDEMTAAKFALVNKLKDFFADDDKTAALTASALTLGSGAALAAEYDVREEIAPKIEEFCRRYDFNEGDLEKTFGLYDCSLYSSGIEERGDGTFYEQPAFYFDDEAGFYGGYELNGLKLGLTVNGAASAWSGKCYAYNGRTLVPLDVFRELGYSVDWDAENFVATVTDGETVLEILPNLVGMRKNRDEGYYVPTVPCARMINGTLYVPVRIVAEELGAKVDYIAETASVSLVYPVK